MARKVAGTHNAIRASYQELICVGVGINNVESIIKTVLENLTNLKVVCLPTDSFARIKYTESRRLSQLCCSNYYQILKSHVTITFFIQMELIVTCNIITEQDQALTADIREGSSGNAQTQLNVLVDIFNEI